MHYYWSSSFLFFLDFLFWGGGEKWTDKDWVLTAEPAVSAENDACLIFVFVCIFPLFLGARLSIEGGELFERVIDDDFVLTERACAIFMRQICEGIQFIHLQHVLHLDMKVSFDFLHLLSDFIVCFFPIQVLAVIINWMLISSRRISYAWRGPATGSN